MGDPCLLFYTLQTATGEKDGVSDMAKRLIALVGNLSDPKLLKGLGRNRMSMIWLQDMDQALGYRSGYAGVDWVVDLNASDGEARLPKEFDVVKDSCIWLSSSKPSERKITMAPEVRWGVLPSPVAVRMLVQVCQKNLGSPGALKEECRKIFKEWEQIQEAKQLLMERKAWSEPEAYSYLRRVSMDQCRSMEATAQAVFREYGK